MNSAPRGKLGFLGARYLAARNDSLVGALEWGRPKEVGSSFARWQIWWQCLGA